MLSLMTEIPTLSITYSHSCIRAHYFIASNHYCSPTSSFVSPAAWREAGAAPQEQEILKQSLSSKSASSDTSETASACALHHKYNFRSAVFSGCILYLFLFLLQRHSFQNVHYHSSGFSLLSKSNAVDASRVCLLT